MKDIAEARSEIEIIDKQMAELFERRMDCAKCIAEYKMEKGLSVLDKERERTLIEKNAGYITNPEHERYYRDFLGGLLNVSKDYQHSLMTSLKVAYSGIEGSFASIAVGKIFPDAKKISCKNFAECYQSVCDGKSDFAVMPIENSYAGEVGQVSDLMFNGDLYINGVYELGVSQCLLGVNGSSLSTINKVISHPQALEQCNEFLYEHQIQSIPSENTARAAKEVASRNDVTTAAIASAETAELYGLTIIAPDINKSNNNTTRFAVFSKSKDLNKNNPEYSNSILMFTVKDEAGTLARAVSIVGAYGFNMTVLRSRPLRQNENWQYYFYIELEGKLSGEMGEKMLAELSKICEIIKVVGDYKPSVRI